MGRFLASQMSGAHLMTGLDWEAGWKDKKRKSDEWSLKGSLGKTEYLDDVFNARESENLTLSLSRKRKFQKGAKLISTTLKFQIRHDWLFATNPGELGFRTFTLGQLSIFKPITKKWKYDAIIPVLGLDLEFRDYRNSLSVGPNGEVQDTITPQLLALAIGMKKVDDLKHKTTLMFLSRLNTSDYADQDYLDARISLKHSIRKLDWEGELGTGWVLRSQSEFQGQTRQDDRLEVTASVVRYFKKDKYKAKFFLTWEDQASDFVNYVYDNRKSGLSFSAKF